MIGDSSEISKDDFLCNLIAVAIKNHVGSKN